MKHDQCQKCSASPPCHIGEAEERRGAKQEGSEEGERSRRVHRDKEDRCTRQDKS